MAPSIVEKQWNSMPAADKKAFCDAHNTYGPDFVLALFMNGIKPGTEGYEYKDVLGDAFKATLAKHC
ncbi:hypothetical protein [Streptomyces sp. NPDC059874]|uniref:hypothetical protein n=1 Tax=Streptomyces sp. NPDC059874 TaxID=3346983 RepID=UPI003668F4E5